MMTLLFRVQFPILLFFATYLSLTGTPGAVFESYSDKFLHVLCWCVLFVSLRIALGVKPYFGFSALGLWAYSAGVECLQNLSPERHFSWLDMLANGLGVLVGMGLWFMFVQVRTRVLAHSSLN
jgi:VanZ family protein